MDWPTLIHAAAQQSDDEEASLPADFADLAGELFEEKAADIAHGHIGH